MSGIAIAAITVMAITGVVITVVAMVTPIGTTLILIIILIFILIIILILSTALVVGTAGVVGKGATIVAAKAQLDRAGTSRHGFGACGAAGAAIFLSLALSASDSPRAPAQSGSARKLAARAFAASLVSSKGDIAGLLNRATNA
jgi:hypothetical protein